jgi:hypothetical protein
VRSSDYERVSRGPQLFEVALEGEPQNAFVEVQDVDGIRGQNED